MNRLLPYRSPESNPTNPDPKTGQAKSVSIADETVDDKANVEKTKDTDKEKK